MAQFMSDASALHVAWLFASTDTTTPGELKDRLVAGHESRIYHLQSLDCQTGWARAVLTPETPLETMVEFIWGLRVKPVSLSVVESPD
jgi:hypothetical protein